MVVAISQRICSCFAQHATHAKAAGHLRCQLLLAPFAPAPVADRPLPPRTRVAAQSFAANEALHGGKDARKSPGVDVEQRVLQVTDAVFLLVGGACQFAAVGLTVGQRHLCRVLLHIRFQRIQVARGRVVVRGSCRARGQGQQ